MTEIVKLDSKILGLSEEDVDIDTKIDMFIDIMKKHERQMYIMNEVFFGNVFGSSERSFIVHTFTTKFNKKENVKVKTRKNTKGYSIKFRFF